jgi:outer membrane beta-barrel protein
MRARRLDGKALLMLHRTALAGALLLAGVMTVVPARAQGPAEAAPPAAPAAGAKAPEKKVSIDHLRKQYWNLNGSVGYYFSELVGARLMYWHFLASESAAAKAVPTLSGGTATASTNEPSRFIGAEATVNAIYGKLSLFGQKILYYDFLLAAGGGQVKTETGSGLAPLGGITQNVYLNQWLGLRIDYRLMTYDERVNITSGPSAGSVVQRRNWTNAIQIGANFLF